ncbi:uncharacterized protein LOC122172662 isoform X1 [Chrysemys picta bellii]|uniref:uncharacterized protein LOC122172662 isoform X1 n=1 Tax=Chrysemys picta bellii TaxID=8478 RepID=UPI0032B18346
MVCKHLHGEKISEIRLLSNLADEGKTRSKLKDHNRCWCWGRVISLWGRGSSSSHTDEVLLGIQRCYLARRVPRSHLLQDRPNKENNRTPLAVTFSPQLKPLQRIIRDLQPILKDDPLLSQILGDRPVLAYRQPPNLKQILTSNHTSLNKTTDLGTYPCNKARCQLCPHIYSSDIIIAPNHISHTIRGSFTCTSTNVIYAIMCQQCPSAMYIGQTGQSLRKRINGHKSDIRNHNTQKPEGEHFNLSGHSMSDLRVAILQQKNFKNRLQRETAKLELICKLDTINSGLNKDWEWLSHYKH